jgi:2-oxoglutarate ferredoxin oxidoreductase subunit alpha
VLGAGWNGARAFTSTSGPGISLMNELIGFAYYTEVPCVLVDVQRTGPSTGMPTRTQQGDLLECAYASHGDTRHILLFPADPNECFTFAAQAFDLAERYQTVVFLVSDLDIGMNDWVCDALTWDDDRVLDRGKVLHADELAEMTTFHRYTDVDGDGICARTLPGEHPTGAYFLRGSGHNAAGGYTEDADEYMEVVNRLDRKIGGAADVLPAPVSCGSGNALGLISVGSSAPAVAEARATLAADDVAVDTMSIKGFPFSAAVQAFIDAHERVFVVDQNRDGQLYRLLLLETDTPRTKLVSIRYYGGLPLCSRDIVTGVNRELAAERSSA